MTRQKSGPIAEEAQKGQNPGRRDTRSWTNGKEPLSSVSQRCQSKRISQWTPQHQSARVPPITQHQGKMYIKTIRIVDDLSPIPTPMSLPLFTPSPKIFLTPLIDNDAARRPDTPRPDTPDDRRLGPPHQSSHYPARPGSTHPVTPNTEGASSDGGGGSSNKENNDNPNNPYCVANLRLTWRLARGARGYLLANGEWPRGVEQYAQRIFKILACPEPHCLADVQQYNIDGLSIFGTLKAWKDKLEEYMVREDLCLGAASPSLSPERQRKRKAEEDWEDTQSKVNRVRTWENACMLLQKDNVPMAQQGMRSS
jgi:hypothetical protein